MRVLIVGAGRIATRHLRALATIEDATLAGIVDPDLDAARRMRERYGGDIVAADMLKAFDEVPVDHVIISAPTGLHHSLAAEAIRHGKHVLVEKPFTQTSAEARDLVEQADVAGVKLASAQLLRFLPIFEWAREYVASGALGDPIQAVERRLTHRPEVFPWWKDVPNFLVAHWGSHSIDVMCDVLGTEPESIYCQGRSVNADYGTNDFSLQITMKGGTRFGSHMSFASRYPAHDIVLIGSASTLQFDCYTTLRCDGTTVMQLTSEEMLAQGFIAQLRDFLSAEDGSRLRSSARSVIPSLEVIDAAAESMRTRSIVEL